MRERNQLLIKVGKVGNLQYPAIQSCNLYLFCIQIKAMR